MERPKNYKDLMIHYCEEEDYPENDGLILMYFDHTDIPVVGRYQGNEEDGYAFYDENDDRPLESLGWFVSYWIPLPEKGEGR